MRQLDKELSDVHDGERSLAEVEQRGQISVSPSKGPSLQRRRRDEAHLVRELSIGEISLSLAQKLDISSSALETVLELGLVLDDERLAVLDLDGRKDLCRDSGVGCLRLDDQTFVARDSRENGRLLHGPDSNVREGLATDGGLLDGGGGGPTGLPAIERKKEKEAGRVSTLELVSPFTILSWARRV